LRRTKIVCNIGPASQTRGVLAKLLQAGMEVARLNFSHGTHDWHAQTIGHLRELAAKQGRPLAILQDLSGPKVRLGAFATPSVSLKRGQEVGFCAEPVAPANGPQLLLPLPVPELLAALEPGHTLLLDDGKLQLRVLRSEGEPGTSERCVWTRCLVGGELKPRKGVTAPGVAFNVPAVTEKDKADLRFGLAQGVDWVAASYVRCAEDIAPLRAIMAEMGIAVPLIVKVEKAEAVRDFDAILAAVDGVMVARGDLGVEMPFDEVPLVQKRIIRACNRAGKPVITATQMLESMMQNPRPTRAEATDVANAIFDGTDAVMLSGETAAGQYPVEAARTMAQIARRADEALYRETGYEPPRDRDWRKTERSLTITDAVARAAAEIAEIVGARAILCATTSGGTARKVAQWRPRVPILGATHDPATYRQLALSWGVTPCLIGPIRDTDMLMRTTITAAQALRLVKTGDRVVLTAGVPVNRPGTTNLIEVHTIGQPLHPLPPEHVDS
jgi:pyruvate kinase